MVASDVGSVTNIKHHDELQALLEDWPLDRSEVCLVGSTCLAVRGLRLNNDIDVAVERDEADRLDGGEHVGVSIGRYDVFGISNRQLIDNDEYHDIVDGFKIVRPELEYAYKSYRGKKKDEADIELLNEYREATADWNDERVVYRPPDSLRDVLRQTSTLGPGHVPHLLRRYADESDGSLQSALLSRLTSRRSIIGRTYQSLKRDGIATTVSRGVGLMYDNDPTGVLRTYSNPRHKIKLGQLVDRELETFYPTKDLLRKQFTSGGFRRYDTLVCLGVIDGSIDPDALRELDDGGSCHSTITRYLDSEVDREPVVRIDTDSNVLDPDELAVALHQKRDHVRVDISRGRSIPDCDRAWLRTASVSEEEREQLETLLRDLLDEYGLLFKLFVWPPAEEFVAGITDTVSKYGELYGEELLQFEPETFDEFVHDLYMIEDEFKERAQNRAKIQAKVNFLRDYGSTVRVLNVRFHDPKLKEGDSNQMAFLKEAIRQKYHTEVPLQKGNLNPLVHGTDNYVHNQLVNRVIDQYRERTIAERVVETT